MSPTMIKSSLRPDERQRRYLSKVVPPFGSGEAPRHALGERQVPLDQACPLGLGCSRFDEHSPMLLRRAEEFLVLFHISWIKLAVDG